MVIKTPSTYFLVRGHSEGYMPLNAFDGALMNAGIGDLNLVRMSSILPPACRRIDPKRLPPGALIPTAYATLSSSVPGEIIAAGVAVAIPQDPSLSGLIMEYEAVGTSDEIERIVRRMAEEGMRSRERAIREIQSIAVQHEVKQNGSVLAALVLWDE